MGQTEAVEHSSAWKKEEPHWLIGVRGESAPFKASLGASIATSAVVTII